MGRVEFWAHVEKLAESLTMISHFELLGLDEDGFDDSLSKSAGPTSLTDAYHEALRRYHPDRHVVSASAEQKRALARICARIGEAYRVLSSETARSAYLETRATGTPMSSARTKRST